MTGKGKLTWEYKGDRYEYNAEFKDDSIISKGVLRLRYSDGKLFEGEANESYVPDCKGKIILLDLNKYEGTWESGKIKGEGILTYFSGNKFKGKVNDEYIPDGEGVMICSAKWECKGVWVNGNLSSCVELKYHNGSEFRWNVNNEYVPNGAG